MPHSTHGNQTVETDTHITQSAQTNTSSVSQQQFRVRLMSLNIPLNGTPHSINQVVQRVEAGGQHPVQRKEDFKYLQRTIGNQAVIQLLDGIRPDTQGDIPKNTLVKSYKQENILTTLAKKDHLNNNAFNIKSDRMRPKTLLQRKTTVLNTSQNYTYNGESVSVGEKMEAWLDPKSPKQGQSAELNTSQNEMMEVIRGEWNIEGGDVVKGHLLNDNLGGEALNENLYPITRSANKDHLGYAENHVKKETWVAGMGVYYKVKVEGTPDIGESKASFDIELRHWDPNGENVTNGQMIVNPLRVNSDFNDVRRKGGVEALEDDDDEPQRIGNPRKQAGFVGPKKRVRDLTDMEAKRRQLDK